MQNLRPTVWIGKQGCTQTMIDEIVSQLKKRKLIKVKWLQNTEVDPEDVAREARANLIEVRGRTMVLGEKGKTISGNTAKAGNVAKPQKSARSRLLGKMKKAEK
jgi:RNA-binding protein